MLTLMNRLILATSVFPLILGACESPLALPEVEVCEPPAVPLPVVDYRLVDLPDDSLWYRGTALQSFTDYPQDEDGVIVFTYDGERYYNPVQMAQRGMWFGDNYRRTGDVRYLERSEAHARHLIQIGLDVDGALFFPYRFNFRLHGNPDQVMQAPWYSGMAQGQALSLFLRLHQMTGRDEYRVVADRVLASLSHLRSEGGPYVSRIDCEGYFWIEEFPMEVSTKTLNGFIFAMYGAYEYWRATGDEEAERLVLASLATLKRYMEEYRVPRSPSYYCLKHRAQYPLYHNIHIEQFGYVRRLSADPFFEEMADQFAADFFYERP